MLYKMIYFLLNVIRKYYAWRKEEKKMLQYIQMTVFKLENLCKSPYNVFKIVINKEKETIY